MVVNLEAEFERFHVTREKISCWSGDSFLVSLSQGINGPSLSGGTLTKSRQWTTKVQTPNR